MREIAVFLGFALCAWATPITGSFGLSTNANFVDIFGADTNLIWQFHQGDGPTSYLSCQGPGITVCSADFGFAPDATLIRFSLGYSFAQDGAFQAATGFYYPGFPGGQVEGFLDWQIAQTDWSDIPLDTGVFLTLPMTVSGRLSATDANGFQFMDYALSGTGTFGTFVVRSANSIAFIGAAGDFTGDVNAVPEPATLALLGLGLLALGFRHLRSVRHRGAKRRIPFFVQRHALSDLRNPLEP